LFVRVEIKKFSLACHAKAHEGGLRGDMALAEEGLMKEVIPYNKNLVEKAREYRKNHTLAEKTIWENLFRNKQLLGYKFTRQKPLLHFIADFYCSKLLLVVEIDGEYHKYQIARDDERTRELEEYGLKVIRFSNEDIIHNLSEIEKELVKKIKVREMELLSPLNLP
jgi:very-short-patch-repair endonuclease